MWFAGPNGSGGKAFESRHGTVRNSIRLEYDAGKESQLYGWDIDKTCFHVPEGDAIVRVQVRCGWGTDALRFRTRNGVESVWFGGSGGTRTKTFEAPAGHELFGVKGRSGSLLDKVEPIWGETPYVTGVVCKLEPIFEVAKGTGFHQSETIKYRVGTSTEQYSSYQIGIFAAHTEAKVNVGLFSANAEANVSSMMQRGFESASHATSGETEFSRTMNIDAREHGVYLYRGVNIIILSNGRRITMKGSSTIGSPTALVHPAREFEFA